MKAFRTFTRFYSVRDNLKNNPIENDTEMGEFKIKLNGDFAMVQYKQLDENTYNLLHTYIPETYQGQGLGLILAERIFKHLIQNENQMKVSCEFLQKFLEPYKDKYSKYVLSN